MLCFQEQRHRFVYKITIFCNKNDAHGHGDEIYAHYALNMYHGNYKHTLSLFARLLHDLEESLISSFCNIFKGSGWSPLYRAILHKSDIIC